MSHVVFLMLFDGIFQDDEKRTICDKMQGVADDVLEIVGATPTQRGALFDVDLLFMTLPRTCSTCSIIFHTDSVVQHPIFLSCIVSKSPHEHAVLRCANLLEGIELDNPLCLSAEDTETDMNVIVYRTHPTENIVEFTKAVEMMYHKTLRDHVRAVK